MLDTIIWAALIGVFIALEAATVALLSTWFIIGSAAALVVSLFTPSIPIQVSVFVAVSLLSFLFLRPLAQKRFFVKKEATNADRVVGATATVLEEITRETGLVKVNGAEWTARTASDTTIPKGTAVQVLRIEGVKVIVEKRED